MIDYLIIGNGIAGVCFAELALKSNKSILVFDNGSQPSSRIAGGLYNPVVLKRFSEIWKAKEQVELVDSFYPELEKTLGTTFDYKLPIYRKFASIEEQNNWFQAADKPSLSDFLNTNLYNLGFSNINASFGFGEVYKTGYLDIKAMVESYSDYLKAQKLLIEETFDYSKIEFFEYGVRYHAIEAKHIVFCEGFGLHANPYFNDLPLDGTKGELLIIKAPELQLQAIVKSNIFILPIGNDLYKVGATYNWEDKTNLPTASGKLELLQNLEELINCHYEVVAHFAGVRPTVKDRRPLVGTHYVHKKLHILNGLGTRGVMLGPFLAKQLFEYLENESALDKEIDINRFYKKRGLL
jgi:glycine/D-amino acid oxidase-like deaminating enzyme